jgi:hypothetical protein
MKDLADLPAEGAKALYRSECARREKGDYYSLCLDSKKPWCYGRESRATRDMLGKLSLGWEALSE